MADLLIALTVKQPWASAIIYGDKDIENRVWRTGYRGRLLIHAGKAVDWLAPDHAWTAAGLAPYRRGAPRVAWTASLPLSVILGAVTLTGCHLDAGMRAPGERPLRRVLLPVGDAGPGPLAGR